MLKDIYRCGKGSVQVLQGSLGGDVFALEVQSRQDSRGHFAAGVHKVRSDFLQRTVPARQSQREQRVQLLHDVGAKLRHTNVASRYLYSGGAILIHTHEGRILE